MNKNKNFSNQQILTGLKILAQIIAKEEIKKLVNKEVLMENTSDV